MDIRNQVLLGNCLDKLKEMPADSVQCVVTSPPYWGLRDYGVPPSIWGGDPACEHDWGENLPHGRRGNRGVSGTGGALHPTLDETGSGGGAGNSGEFCTKCDAWRGAFGLEPNPDQYVKNLVEICREVRRVLRPDGTFWLNIGDCYVGANNTDVGGNSNLGKPASVTAGSKVKAGWKGLAPKQLVMIPHRAALALQADGWWVRSDIAWCLSGGTRVYARTQNGEGPTMLRELTRLDPSTVQLWNGQRWTQVLQWTKTPQPLSREHAVEIVLRSGERIGCTSWHQWPTNRGLVNADQLREGDIIETCVLPEPVNVALPSSLDDSEIGWFVGLYLAEGSRSHGGGTLQFAGHRNETEYRVERLRRIAESFHGVATPHPTTTNGATVNVSGKMLTAIIDTYIGGHTSRDKYLHAECWRRSNKFLKAVLEGYLEGDGHNDPHNDRWRLGFTRNYNLEASLRTLCARLGVQLRLKPAFSEGFGKKWPSFKGEVRFTKSDHHSNREDGEVVEIRRSRAREFWDVSVADEPHLFALASGVLTHNCKKNPMPESVTDRPARAHETFFLLAKSPDYFYDHIAVRVAEASVTTERYNYLADDGRIAKSGAYRDAFEGGNTALMNRAQTGMPQAPTDGKRNLWSYWLLATRPYKEAHFAVFPPTLPEICIKAGTSEGGACKACETPYVRKWEIHEETITEDREEYTGEVDANDIPIKVRMTGGQTVKRKRQAGWAPKCKCGVTETVPCLVLDIFAGSGTTLMVAKELRRDFVGIELNPDYAKLIQQRTFKAIEAESSARVNDHMWALEDE